jgi:hypothetical protein
MDEDLFYEIDRYGNVFDSRREPNREGNRHRHCERVLREACREIVDNPPRPLTTPLAELR